MRAFNPTPTHAAMNGNFSLYRVGVKNIEMNRFWEILSNIRPDQYKIRRIDPRNESSLVDIIVTPEELSFLVVAFTDIRPAWIQDWMYETI